MLRPLVILTIALTVLSNNGQAQRLTKNDSLRNNINKAATDSLKVEALYEYMKANLNNNTSDFGPYVKQMASLSRKINFKWGLSTAYILSLSYYKNHGKFELALKYADSATAVTKADTAKNMRINMGHISLNRGNLYYNIGDNENALKDYFKAAKVFNQEHHRFLSTAYSNISNCFMALNDFKKGITYAQLAVNSAKQFDDKRLLATDLMNLATAYMNSENYKVADSLMHVVWPIVSALQNSKSFYLYYYNKGDIAANYQKDTLKALSYYHKAYEYALKNEDVWQLGRSFDFIVHYQLALKQKEAKANIDKLYQFAKENDQMDTKASALDYYSKWYSSLGDYKKAYEYQKLYHAVSDSLQSDNIKEKAAMMDVRFRVANKEQEITQLKDT
jgi:tetratricopeptide (TPR) repeat protein